MVLRVSGSCTGLFVLLSQSSPHSPVQSCSPGMALFVSRAQPGRICLVLLPRVELLQHREMGNSCCSPERLRLWQHQCMCWFKQPAGDDFKPTLALYQPIVSAGFVITLITLRCCQLKPAAPLWLPSSCLLQDQGRAVVLFFLRWNYAMFCMGCVVPASQHSAIASLLLSFPDLMQLL